MLVLGLTTNPNVAGMLAITFSSDLIIPLALPPVRGSAGADGSDESMSSAPSITPPIAPVIASVTPLPPPRGMRRVVMGRDLSSTLTVTLSFAMNVSFSLTPAVVAVTFADPASNRVNLLVGWGGAEGAALGPGAVLVDATDLGPVDIGGMLDADSCYGSLLLVDDVKRILHQNSPAQVCVCVHPHNTGHGTGAHWH